MSGRAATLNVIAGNYALSVGKSDMPAPKGWHWVSLCEVARLESGHTPSRERPKYWDGDIPWIGIKDARIHHGATIHETLQTVTPAGIENSAARVLPAATVCLSRTASVGYVVVMGRDMATSQDFVNWICGPAIEPQFLKQLLIAENESLFRFGKGSTHTTIYYPEVKAFHVCLPPVAEQRRIVAKLQALQARSRRAREALDAVRPLLEKLRQSILAAAFRGDLTKDWRAKHPDVEPATELLKRIRIERRKKWEEAELAKMKAKGKTPTDDRWKAKYKEPEPVDASGLPELPQGWCWASLDELAWDASYGTSVKCDVAAPGIPILRIPNVANGEINLSDLKSATGALELDPSELLQTGDLLVIRTNGSRELVGRCALVQNIGRGFYFASYLIRFRVLPLGELPAYVAYVAGTPAVRQTMMSESATSAGQYNISMSKLARVLVPVPPADEMVALLVQVGRCTQLFQAAEEQMTQAESSLDMLASSTLAKAFRGELVPQDPNDEPAEALLARLRAADVTVEKPKRPRTRSEAAE